MLQIINTQYIADISADEISDEAYEFLRNNCQDYTSQVGSEHLFNVSNIDIEDDENEMMMKTAVEIVALIKFVKQNGIDYIRVVKAD